MNKSKEEIEDALYELRLKKALRIMERRNDSHKESVDEADIPTVSVGKYNVLVELHMELIRRGQSINPQTMRDAKQLLTSNSKIVSHMTEPNRRNRAMGMVQSLMGRLDVLSVFNDVDFAEQKKLYNSNRTKVPGDAVFDALNMHLSNGVTIAVASKSCEVHSMSVHQLKRRMKRYTDYAERLKNTA